jgi:methionyl-tRNA synthetase
MENVFIGGAWPYANGSLHLGHISGLLPGDILARYYRLKGDDVLYVSGSDCNGTPIAIRARQEGKEVGEITNHYHEEFERCFESLGFSYDFYSRTDHPQHHKVVQNLFLKLLEKDIIYKKTVEQSFCVSCIQFLPDRYVEGICPHCHAYPARGDQCDECSSILDPLELLQRKCKLCGGSPSVRETLHFYLSLSSLQGELEKLLNEKEVSKTWRENAIQLTKRYLQEGLQDRAVSRDLTIGVPVPVEGFEEKKIYVWIEAVAGYLSASKQWSKTSLKEWEPFWKGEGKAYYVHGKDNIPFHTIIWPALLIGSGNYRFPTHIISNEYLTLERKKISTSRNYAVWVPDLLDKFHPDSIRYFVTINSPEKRDADFSWREFIYSHNGELLGAYGNLVNRTLKFIEKSFERNIPRAQFDGQKREQIIKLYQTTGAKIEKGEIKASLQEIFDFIREANKYFDDQKPWITVKENVAACENTLYTCVQIIANLSNLLSPFLPFSSEKIRGFLQLGAPKWSYTETIADSLGEEISVLFERIDPLLIETERNKLGLST